MGRLRLTLAIASTMLMIGCLGMMASAVDWTDDITDPVGDVEDEQNTTHPDVHDVDIISASVDEDGDNINVTMVLAGALDTSASFMIYLEVDGEESFSFHHTVNGFTVRDPDYVAVNAVGFVSADEKTLSWVVAKSDIGAQSRIRIDMALASSTDYSDFAGIFAPLPKSLEVQLYFDGLNVLVMKSTMIYEGENAEWFRDHMDENGDGTVSAAELQSFQDDMNSAQDTDPSESNVTLDDKDPTDLDWDNSIDGAQGAVDGTSDVKIIAKAILTFPKVEDQDTHDVLFKDGFMGDDFIGGDEPWEDEFELLFKLSAPDGWKLKSDSLPTKMKDYLNDDGDEVKIQGTNLQNEWDDTFGKLTTLTIEKSDESPGFGLTLALGATLLAAVVVTRRRR